MRITTPRSIRRYAAGAAIAGVVALGGVGLANAQSDESTDSVIVTDDTTDETTDDTTDETTSGSATDGSTLVDGNASATLSGPGERPGRGGRGSGGCDDDAATDGAGSAVIEDDAADAVTPTPDTEPETTVDADDL